MRPAAALRILAVLAGGALCWLLLSAAIGAGPELPPLRALLQRSEVPPTEGRPPPSLPCSLPRRCPPHHFPFRLRSGAANVVGPKICLGGRMLMSSAQNNVGRGLNVALVNGVTGELMAARSFDMWAGDSNELLKFLRPLHEGTVVLVASYDDPATRGCYQIWPRNAYVSETTWDAGCWRGVSNLWLRFPCEALKFKKGGLTMLTQRAA